MDAAPASFRGAERVCPVFVGRLDLLALARRRQAAALEGRGGLLLIAGEAGIGKSRLMEEVVALSDVRRVHADAYADDRETPGMLLLGVAASLAEAGDAPAAERIRGLVLHGDPADAADPAARTARRRLLVAELATTLATALTLPTILALEDVHWADQLGLDVLRRVAVAVRERPSLVVATFRTEDPEVAAEATSWRLDLVGHRLAEEVRPERLGADGVARMLAAIRGTEPSAEEAERLHAVSDGIPLHVEELLADGLGGFGGSDDPGGAPETVAAAVLSRTRALTPASAAVLDAAAVIGREFDVRLLAVVVGDELDRAAREAALDDLAAQHLLVRATAGGYDFRHALIRDAVYSAVPSARRRTLHGRVVDAGAGLSDALLSLHAERAGRARTAYALARRAAERASMLSAHREAADLYRRAQRTMPLAVEGRDRADLLRRLGAELAAVDANREAEAEFARAIELYRAAGVAREAAAVAPALVAARHLLGADCPSRVADLRAALGWIDGDDDAEAVQVRGRLLAAQAAAAMLERRLDDARRVAEEARPLLTAEADQIGVDATLGSVLVFAGDGDPAWDLLRTAAEEGAAHGREEAAARAYRMLGSSASVLLQYGRGVGWLADGIAYAERIERWNDAHYLTAHLAHVRWATGDLRAAAELAGHALADGRGGITTEVTALHVLGYCALSSGDLGRAGELLRRAEAIGERMQELQRLSPALWGLAETALLAGDAAEAVRQCERGAVESHRVEDSAYAFPFAVTGVRAYLAAGDVAGAQSWLERVGALVERRRIPGTEFALQHAAGLLALRERRPSDARELLGSASAGWDALGRWWEGTQAILDRAECARRTRSPVEAAALVAEARTRAPGTVIARRADELAARLAEGVVPSTLSAREEEVAAQIAGGATNREIAAVLHIAPKTVSTHVEHILAKLGASRRAEIAAWAAERRA
ncbi:helix-turn-helix transcriptional regulator [Leifsonia shinshuensis]|uniref:AAA family ATPase n=1 Tax=Leifsonia shinshuensis TaxID=150026 RepID=A0A7G6Y7S6_9MICO|nr:LuxR family transcriptional regulator [Leifsonia shinshuensis]QNE34541.1 AAA family ATPase [Leifsonia shinshuensis]